MIILTPLGNISIIFIINYCPGVMQVEDRKYENVLQFIFGLVLVVVLSQCLLKSLVQLWIYLFR